MPAKKANYWDYIHVEQLLSLQSGIDESESDLSNDEVRFIVIHQVDELWFKLILRELVAARDLFAKPRVPEDALAGATQSLKRITMCFEQAGQQFRLMETMSTQDYLMFRDKLNPASGFQSAQMREMEVLMGLQDEDRIPFGKEGSYLDALRSHDGSPSPAHAQVMRRIGDTPTLKDAVRSWLYRTPIQGSLPDDDNDKQVVADWTDQYYRGHEQLHERAIQHAVAVQALAKEDEQRLRDRYNGQLRGAKRHLEAEDVPDADRVVEVIATGHVKVVNICAMHCDARRMPTTNLRWLLSPIVCASMRRRLGCCGRWLARGEHEQAYWGTTA